MVPGSRWTKVVLLAAMPGLAVLVWTAYGVRGEVHAEVVRQAASQAEFVALEQERVLESTRMLLATLAHMSPAWLGRARCADMFAHGSQHSDMVAALSFVSPAGRFECSSDPRLLGRMFGDPELLREVGRRGEFAVGRHLPGQVTGRPILLTGYPVVDGSGASAGTVAAGLEIEALLSHSSTRSLPQGTRIAILTRDGQLLARLPFDSALAQRTFADVPLVAAARTGESAQLPGLDGVERIYAFAPLPINAASGMFVAVGMPAPKLSSYMVPLIWRAGIAAALALVIVLLLSRKQHSTDVADEAKRAAQRERFFQSLIEKAFDAVCLVTPEGLITYASPAVERVTGYPPGRMVGRSVLDFALPGARPPEDRFREFLQRSGELVISRFMHADGSPRDVEMLGRNLLEDDAVGGIVLNFRDVTDRVAAERSLQLSRDELRELSHRSDALLEAERRHISREVHDGLGQYVTALGLDVAWLRRYAATGDPEARTERLGAMEQVVRETALSVRRVALQLRGGMPEGLSLADSIASHVAELRTRSGLELNFEAGPLPATMARETKTAVFRIVQEALSNVVRHAHATSAKLTLFESAGALHLEVHDDGVGFPRGDSPRGLGLLGMRERALAAGGTLHAGASPLGGAMVRAVIPL